MVILSSTDGEKNLPRYFAQSFGVIKKLNNNAGKYLIPNVS